MPHIVIDASAAADPSLGEWLERSPANVAVLTDYFFMEAYRRGEPDQVQAAFEQLKRRPLQVRILRDTYALSRLPPRLRGARRRMQDERATRDFPKFLENLRAVRSNASFHEAATEHIAAANAQFEYIRTNAQGIGRALKALADQFPKPDLRSMRRGEPYSGVAIGVILQQIANLAKTALVESETLYLPEDQMSLAQSFPFRLSLCTYLTFKARIERGTVGDFLRDERARNDIVDSQYAAAALYFDGLRTNDELLEQCFFEASTMMSFFFMRAG